MKKYFLLAVIMVFAMTATALAIAIIDEDGNIIQENEPLPGGIVPLMGDLELDLDFDGEVTSFPAFGFTPGEVVEFWKNEIADTEFIRIRHAVPVPDDEEGPQYSYTDFGIDSNTFIMGEFPEIGDTITGFFDNNRPMIMIYPPQHIAVVIVNRTEDLPRIIVDRFDDEWISSCRQFRLNISDETEIVFQGGDKFEGDPEELIGRKLVVEFMISHRDIPETIPNPQKIIVLYERAVHPIIEIDPDLLEKDIVFNDDEDLVLFDPWDKIEWSGTEGVDWNNYEIIITINGLSRGVPNARVAYVTNTTSYNIADAYREGTLVYVPLRAITELLGFVPEWNAERPWALYVTIDGPLGKISLSTTTNEYELTTQNGIVMKYTMPPPLLHNDRTYVPLEFFREIYGFTNAWFEGGQVHLDNSPQME